MKIHVAQPLFRVLLALVLVAGCSTLKASDPLASIYGNEVPVNRIITPTATLQAAKAQTAKTQATIAQATLTQATIAQTTKTQAAIAPATKAQTLAEVYLAARPVLENRCVVCHACYDAPCQLKLSSPEGIDRGASKQRVYDGTRLLAAMPTRLGVDAQTTPEWRSKGFFPVLNERTQVPENNTQASVLYRMLQLKQQHPLPNVDVLDEQFTFGLDRVEACPRLDEMAAFEKSHAQWGMPYGLPGLTPQEHEVLKRWLEQGGAMSLLPPLGVALQKRVDEWEAFLNDDSLKQQLASRYIYEHLFLAHLYFDDVPEREYFTMVRSSTPPGLPISVIATRQPYDDPGVKRVYYRLQRDESSVVAKTHMPYALNTQQLNWMKSLFVTPDYRVTTLPDYRPETSSNPFLAFRELPVESRYRLMLEHAQFTIMGFIKGPVCRGQVALNVIDDHFWAVFIDPRHQNSQTLANFLVKQGENLGIPNVEEERGAGVVKAWVEYSLNQRAYLQARAQQLDNFFSKGQTLDLDMIWDGDGHNKNAAVTIFRHFDSSTVEQGLLGQPPKTMWVISYPLLERIHYLLVAGFDVYGNIGHQLDSRLYMDFLRMEGEFNFLTFLPKKERRQLRKFWYRDVRMEVSDYVFKPALHFHQDTAIAFKTADPKQEFYDLLKARLAPVLNRRHELTTRSVPFNQGVNLQRLNEVVGEGATLFPELSMLLIEGDQHADEAYTLIRNSGHSNIASLLNENDNRLPQEDYLTLLKGISGAYPAVFWRVKEGDILRFVDAVTRVKNEQDYQQLLKQFGVRRTAPDFWAVSDRMHALYRKENPEEAGLLDYSRLENR